jgi:hypothetical protein
MLPSAFGYVEGAGLFYGMSLIARTLYRGIYIGLIRIAAAYESVCEPQIRNTVYRTGILIFLCRKGSDCKGAFDLMGWDLPL